jgi:hypothetical protein
VQRHRESIDIHADQGWKPNRAASFLQGDVAGEHNFGRFKTLSQFEKKILMMETKLMITGELGLGFTLQWPRVEAQGVSG